MVGAGGGHGYGRPELQETPPVRLAVTTEQENGDHRIQIRGYTGYTYIWVLNTEVGFRVFSKRFRHFAVTHGEPVRLW